MQKSRRVIVIAKQREFDEETWKQLLTAFAYVLHERRKAQEDAAMKEAPNTLADAEAA